jgi:hypothetical protein
MDEMSGVPDGKGIDVVASSPVILHIGVTGHRRLDRPDMVRARVKEVLALLDGMLTSGIPDSPVIFMAISPAAEGADRIVAREVLAWKGEGNGCLSFLEVVLPMPREEYEKDFRTGESLLDFRDLVARARLTPQMEDAGSRELAYLYAGRYVVDHSDILIAVWNGKEAAGVGGTADIVQYARQKGHPLIWINSETGEVRYEWDRQKVLNTLKLRR